MTSDHQRKTAHNDGIDDSEYIFLFDHNPSPLITVDLSAFRERVTALPQQSFADVMRHIHADLWDVDELFSLVLPRRVNAAALELFRCESEPAFFQWFAASIRSEAVAPMMAAMVALVHGQLTARADSTFERRDGEPVRLRLDFRRAPDDTALQRVLVAIGVREELTVFQQQLNTMAMLPEKDPNVVLMMECGSGISYANPAGRHWLKEHGRTQLDHLHDVLPERFRESYCPICDRQTGEIRSYSRDGKVIDLRVSPFPGANRCALYVNDVTRSVTLQRERDVYFKALEASGNSIAITDSTGAIEYVNPAFESHYGYSLEDVRGQNPRVLNPGPLAYRDMGVSEEEYRRLFREMWESIRKTGTWEGDVFNQSRDGDVRKTRLLINHISGEAEVTNKYVAVATDIEAIQRREMGARLEILETITRVGELRDNETGHHMIRVGLYARLVAEQLGLPRNFCEQIEQFAPMHDIGKVGISDAILLAPRRLTDEEFAIIRQHTTLGYSILMNRPSLEMAAQIARSHHERYDGTGYPEGIAATDIPLAARIVAICDVYDALRSYRVYKGPWSHDQARNEIIEGSGTQFCPEITDAFLARESEFLDISRQYADETVS